MALHMEDDREELDDVAVAFRVHEELDERLAQVWTNHRDPTARERLLDYLDSPRLIRGLESTQRLAPGEAPQ